MTCETFKVGDGFAIICNRGKRWPRCSVPGCDRLAPKLCDYPCPRKKSGTCDAKLCNAHAVVQGEDRDFCPPHAKHTQRSLPL
jgi:hypothetical protein